MSPSLRSTKNKISILKAPKYAKLNFIFRASQVTSSNHVPHPNTNKFIDFFIEVTSILAHRKKKIHCRKIRSQIFNQLFKEFQ